MTSTEQTQEHRSGHDTGRSERSTGSESRSTTSSEDYAREGQVNSGGESLKGRAGDALEVGAGLVVGAGAYSDGVTTRNPYYQSGNVETGGYGGPPNVSAVTPIFKQARANALALGKAIVQDTTGNAIGVGKGVGEGLAPELVNLPPLTGAEAREAGKDGLVAAADYSAAHPVSLHALDEGTVQAAQYGDEYGNPIDQDGDGDYSDNSDRSERTSSRRQGAQRQGNAGDEGRGGDRDGDGDRDLKDKAHDAKDSATQSSSQRAASSQGSTGAQSDPQAGGQARQGQSTGQAASGQQGSTGTSQQGGGSGQKRVDPTRKSES